MGDSGRLPGGFLVRPWSLGNSQDMPPKIRFWAITVENGGKNDDNFLEIYTKKEFAGKGGPRKKWLAELLANEKAVV